jgi:hypothetical protein
MKKQLLHSALIVPALLFAGSCAKGPGEGGKASIYGLLTVTNYDATFTTVQATYPGQNEKVYLIFGEDKTFSKEADTNYDGIYEFKYLRPGKYTLFTYSKDTTKYLNGVPSQAGSVIASKTVEVIQEIEITDKKQEVEAKEMVIIK